MNFLLIKTGKNSALLYGNFSTGKQDLWDFEIMGFRNYGICALWDLGIMGFVICGILVLWEKEGEEGDAE